MKREQMEQRVFGRIFLLSNQLQIEGDKLTQELTLKQWFLLLLLYKRNMEKPTINSLSAVMGVTRQSVKKMVSILEEKEFITVSKSIDDSRALCIQPTTKVKDFFQRNKSLGEDFLESVFQGVTEDELSVTVKVLEQLLNNLAARKGKIL